MRANTGSKRKCVAQLCAALLMVGSVWGNLFAKAKEPKGPPATEYVGNLVSFGGTMFVVHIDSYTSDETASAVALAGHDGNANAIRAALGRLDVGFIKLGGDGSRVAFARRQVGSDGTRIVLILRNELEPTGRPAVPELLARDGDFNGMVATSPGRSSRKADLLPPLAAVVVWLPTSGDGSAIVTPAASVVFHSQDDIAITDLGPGPLRVLGVRVRTK